MGARHGKLAAMLATTWEAEVRAAHALSQMADQAADRRVRARLLVLAAFCRAHASRNLSRLVAMGKGPLPVPREDRTVLSLTQSLQHQIGIARVLADRYRVMATLARKQGDMPTSWICELNRSEEEERSEELLLILRESPRESQPVMDSSWDDPNLHAAP